MHNLLNKQRNTGTPTGFGLIHPGNYSTFLRKNRQSLNLSFNFSQKRDRNKRAFLRLLVKYNALEFPFFPSYAQLFWNIGESDEKRFYRP